MKTSACHAKTVESPYESQAIRKRILQTDSIQGLADFWDKNDLTDFDDELEEVDEPVFERPTADRSTTMKTGKPTV